jgi:hypothetical protein
MAQRRRRVSALLAPIGSSQARRIVLAGVAGILLTAPLSLQQAVAPHPVIGWMLTLAGAVLAVCCARQSWVPSAAVARAASAVCLVFCAVTVVLVIGPTVSAMGSTDRQLVCGDDIGLETVGGGQAILHGLNPYSSFDLLHVEVGFGCKSFQATVVRSGVFASATRAPSQQAIDAAARATLAGHPTGGLITAFDYPAGTALLGIIGAHGLVLLSLLAPLLAGCVLVLSVEPSARRAVALALGAQTGTLAVIGTALPDSIVLALLMIACVRRKGILGGAALGLACAIKQTAWFIALPLLVLSWREAGRGRARYAVAATVSCAAVNIPFALADPPTWIKAVLAPQTQPTFPLGFGPGALLTGGSYSSGALVVFSALMVAAVVAGTVWCVRAPRSWAAPGVIIASLGLWVGSRSLGHYIALLGVIAVATVAGSRQVDALGGSVPSVTSVRPEEPMAGTRGALV